MQTVINCQHCGGPLFKIDPKSSIAIAEFLISCPHCKQKSVVTIRNETTIYLDTVKVKNIINNNNPNIRI